MANFVNALKSKFASQYASKYDAALLHNHDASLLVLPDTSYFRVLLMPVVDNFAQIARNLSDLQAIRRKSCSAVIPFPCKHLNVDLFLCPVSSWVCVRDTFY